MTRRNLDVADLTKNIFDYANTDYKNPDFSNTTFFLILKFCIFIFWNELISLLLISSIKNPKSNSKCKKYFIQEFCNSKIPFIP